MNEPNRTGWRAAVHAISQLEVGAVVRFEEIERWFCVTRAERRWNRLLQRAREELRLRHRKALSLVTGVGYSVSTDEQIVNEHVPRAKALIQSATRLHGDYIAMPNPENLSVEARAKHERQQLEAAFLRTAMAQVPRLKG